MFPKVIVFDLDGTLWSPDMYELWGGGGAPFQPIPGTDTEMVDRGGNIVRLLKGTMRLMSELWHYLNIPVGDMDCTLPPFVVAAASTCDEPDWARELLQLFHTRPHPFEEPKKSTAIVKHSLKKKNGRLDYNTDPIIPSVVINGENDSVASAPFEDIFKGFDEIYGGNKMNHMANILAKLKRSKTIFHSNITSSSEKEFYIPPLFAAALPEGTSVDPTTGLVSFTNPKTEASLRAFLEEEERAPLSFKDFVFFDNQKNNIHDVGKIGGITSVYVPRGMTMENWEEGLRQWRREQRPFYP